jgi:hypothetical protein
VIALACLGIVGTAAADPFKVAAIARPPAADADEKAKKDQADAPKSVADVAERIKGNKKIFTLVDTPAAADFVIEVIARHQPGFGPKTITFSVKVGATSLDAHAIKLPGVWRELASNLVDAIAEWATKSDKEIRDVVAHSAQGMSDADRAAMNKTFTAILKQHSWWLSGVDAKPQ